LEDNRGLFKKIISKFSATPEENYENFSDDNQ